MHNHLTNEEEGYNLINNKRGDKDGSFRKLFHSRNKLYR